MKRATSILGQSTNKDDKALIIIIRTLLCVPVPFKFNVEENKNVGSIVLNEDRAEIPHHY